MTRLVFDFDCIIFPAASIAEERFIVATHTPTGREMEFPTKTALYGHHAKKAGGFIAEQNKLNGNDFWKVEDFTILECQRPRPFKVKGKDEDGTPNPDKDYFISPLDGAKQIIDTKIRSICNKLGTNIYHGYTGSGDVFRHNICTLLKYKDRDELMKPLFLDQLKQYVCEKHSCTMITGDYKTNIEADDMLNIDCLTGYNRWIKGGRKDKDKLIAISIDKDSKQCSGWHYNPNKDKDGSERLVEGFGELWINTLDKGKEVDGKGRMWLYFQVACGDITDNYYPNCFSDIKWAEMSAYEALKDCKNDKEAFEALVNVFKKLYPEPKVVKGCKGDVEVSWMYVMQEMFNMAMMLRKIGDSINVKETLDKLKISY
jgi:hypothetical protein